MSGFMRLSAVSGKALQAAVKGFDSVVEALLPSIAVRRNYILADKAVHLTVLKEQAALFDKASSDTELLTKSMLEFALNRLHRFPAQQAARVAQKPVRENLAIAYGNPAISGLISYKFVPFDDVKTLYEKRINPKPAIVPLEDTSSVDNKKIIDEAWRKVFKKISDPANKKILEKYCNIGYSPLVGSLILINSSMRPSGKGVAIGGIFPLDKVGLDINSENEPIINEMEERLKNIVTIFDGNKAVIPSIEEQDKMAISILTGAIKFEPQQSKHSEKMDDVKTSIGQRIFIRSDGDEDFLVKTFDAMDDENKEVNQMISEALQEIADDDPQNDPLVVMSNNIIGMLKRAASAATSSKKEMTMDSIIESAEEAKSVEFFIKYCAQDQEKLIFVSLEEGTDRPSSSPVIFNKNLGGKSEPPLNFLSLLEKALDAYNYKKGLDYGKGKFEEISPEDPFKLK